MENEFTPDTEFTHKTKNEKISKTQQAWEGSIPDSTTHFS